MDRPVLITIDATRNIETISRLLSEAGLRVEDRLDDIGVISGWVAFQYIPRLHLVPGVTMIEHVDAERR